MTTLDHVHSIRKEWQTLRSQMYLTCQKINELEEELAQTKSTKRSIQQSLISLETQEKELLGQIQYCGKAQDATKIKVKKAISASITEAFMQLPKEEKDALVAQLLEGILK